jgi:anti-sigma regulatory factor (Ser/Thr protein kinase)
MLALDFPLGAEALAAAQDRIEAYLEAEDASDRARYVVRLVLDELVANLTMHGRFEGTPPPLRAEVASGRGGVSLALEDAAAPFDPRLPPGPAAPPSLDDDRAGGLGLPLVRRMAEIRDYRRLADGRNRTELWIPAG